MVERLTSLLPFVLSLSYLPRSSVCLFHVRLQIWDTKREVQASSKHALFAACACIGNPDIEPLVSISMFLLLYYLVYYAVVVPDNLQPSSLGGGGGYTNFFPRWTQEPATVVVGNIRTVSISL